MASKVTNESDKSEIALSEQPNQPASFAFPKPNFGSSQRALQSLENVIKAFVHDLCYIVSCAPLRGIHAMISDYVVILQKLLKKQPSFMYT